MSRDGAADDRSVVDWRPTVRRSVALLVAAALIAAAPAAFALTESDLLGTWDLTGYLGIRETPEGSYHLVIDESGASPEYPLLVRVTFSRNAACTLRLSRPEGGTEDVPGRFQKQTVDGEEFIRIRWGAGGELTVTIRVIDPENLTTLFYLSTTGGVGRFQPYVYDTFGTMEKLAGD
jgi:hypothetical protein